MFRLSQLERYNTLGLRVRSPVFTCRDYCCWVDRVGLCPVLRIPFSPYYYIAHEFDLMLRTLLTFRLLCVKCCVTGLIDCDLNYKSKNIVIVFRIFHGVY
jgi:hypothetical protein